MERGVKEHFINEKKKSIHFFWILLPEDLKKIAGDLLLQSSLLILKLDKVPSRVILSSVFSYT